MGFKHLRKSKVCRWGGLLLVGVVLFLGFTFWRQADALRPLVSPLPQDPQIQVYFNHAQSAVYTDPYRQQERLGDDLEQVILETIRSARSSVDVAVQELNLPLVAAALRDQYQAGVAVRVVMENSYHRQWSQLTSQELRQLEQRDRHKYQEFLQLADQNQDGRIDAQEASQSDAIYILEQAGVPLVDDTSDGSKGSDLMHHKFVIVDQTVVLTGSTNFTLSGVHGDFMDASSEGNVNHLLKIASPELAQVFTQEFDLLWGDGPGGQTDGKFGLQKPYRPAQTVSLAPGSSVTVQFSPTSPSQPWQTSVNGLIGATLNQATQSTDLALFVFSEQVLSDILEARHQQGVLVRALIDPGFAFRYYSEGLDLLGVALPDSRCRLEENNHPWRRAIATVGTPLLPEGDKLHHKFAIVDGHTVITGSQNWSPTANHANDENLLVIQNATVAAHFQREFDRLYSTATLGVPGWLTHKVQEQTSQCGL
jgi:phosphatidylserine/phosphatidylglycerophosphate/cardiolipin synthase-like enzyme